MTAAHLPVLDRYLHWVGAYTPAQKTALFSSDFTQALDGNESGRWLSVALEPEPRLDPVDAVLRADTLMYLPEDLLVKVEELEKGRKFELMLRLDKPLDAAAHGRLTTEMFHAVFGRVRIKVQETRCLNNLHQISQALQLYKDNWDKYPIVIDTFVAPVGGSTPVLVRPLFPQYLKSEEVLHCPLAVYPDTAWMAGGT